MSAADQNPVMMDANNDVFTITLNRPEKRNSLNMDLVEGALECFVEATNSGARLVVFRGSGKTFSGGFDFSELEAQTDESLALRFIRIETLLQAVAYSHVSTLALAHGPVFGAGADLFSACDQRVADPAATFRFPGLKFDVVLGTRRLQRIVGTDNARAMLEMSSRVTAEQAYAYGLVTDTQPREKWQEVVEGATSRARMLERTAASALFRVLAADTADSDLADLTRSVSRPGLRERIHQYLNGEKR